MTLKANVQIADDVRLVTMKSIGEHARCAGRQIKSVVVPLECGEPLAFAEPFGARRIIARVDFEPADFRRGRPRHASAQRMRKELAAETMADDRKVARDGIAE